MNITNKNDQILITAERYVRWHLQILLPWETWIDFVYFGAIAYDQLKWFTRTLNYIKVCLWLLMNSSSYVSHDQKWFILQPLGTCTCFKSVCSGDKPKEFYWIFNKLMIRLTWKNTFLDFRLYWRKEIGSRKLKNSKQQMKTF